MRTASRTWFLSDRAKAKPTGVPTQPSRRHRIDRSRPALLQDVWFLEKLARFDEDTARAMGDAPEEIKARHIGNCVKADLAYGEGVANALGIPMGEVARIR